MAAYYAEHCYADAVAAAAAMCARDYPRTFVTSGASGPEVSSLTCTSSGTQLTIAAVSPGASASTSVPVSFPTCDPLEHYADLTALWGFGILALIVVYGARFALRPLMADW